MVRQVVTVVGVKVLSRLASCGQPAVTVSQARSELLSRMLVMGKGTVARHLNPRVQCAAVDRLGLGNVAHARPPAIRSTRLPRSLWSAPARVDFKNIISDFRAGCHCSAGFLAAAGMRQCDSFK